jgi:hypothetical protein
MSEWWIEQTLCSWTRRLFCSTRRDCSPKEARRLVVGRGGAGLQQPLVAHAQHALQREQPPRRHRGVKAGEAHHAAVAVVNVDQLPFVAGARVSGFRVMRAHAGGSAWFRTSVCGYHPFKEKEEEQTQLVVQTGEIAPVPLVGEAAGQLWPPVLKPRRVGLPREAVHRQVHHFRPPGSRVCVERVDAGEL